MLTTACRRPAFMLLTLSALLTTLPACQRQESAEPSGGQQSNAKPTAAPAPAPAGAPSFATRPGAVLLLAQAQFVEKPNPQTGELEPVPQPARVVVLRYDGREWRREVIEDPDSNVFHKAMPFIDPLHPKRGRGVLTIGAQGAYLKLWYPIRNDWEPFTIWHTEFGGRWNRLRDIEIGDVTGDGKVDMAIATHDQGVVEVLVQTAEGYEPHELCREKRTFVHEIELADLDGDGLLEIYATPSAPNRLDGKPQPGEIAAFRYEKGRFERITVEQLPLRHAKEILACNLSPDGKPVLLAAAEGELADRPDAPPEAKRTLIKRYRYRDGKYTSEVVTTLPDDMCRFLVSGDVDGDGRAELIAATHTAGLYLARPTPDGPWPVELIDADSGGFEHATTLADLDGDGVDEIYVVSDKHGQVRRYVWTGRQWDRTTIYDINADCITFNIYAIPAGQAMFGLGH